MMPLIFFSVAGRLVMQLAAAVALVTRSLKRRNLHDKRA